MPKPIIRADLRALTAAQLRRRLKSHNARSRQTKKWTDSDWEVLEIVAELERRGDDSVFVNVRVGGAQ